MFQFFCTWLKIRSWATEASIFETGIEPSRIFTLAPPFFQTRFFSLSSNEKLQQIETLWTNHSTKSSHFIGIRAVATKTEFQHTCKAQIKLSWPFQISFKAWIKRKNWQNGLAFWNSCQNKVHMPLKLNLAIVQGFNFRIYCFRLGYKIGSVYISKSELVGISRPQCTWSHGRMT